MNLVETIVAMALTVILSGTIVSLVAAGQAMARTQPEATDLQQRARIALATLGGELRDAGAGLERGPMAGSLARYFPAVTPSPDGGITIWKVTHRAAQAVPALIVMPGATTVTLRESALCPSGEAACAFLPATAAIAFTSDGCRTALQVGGVSGDALQLSSPLAGCTLDTASAVAEGEVSTFRVDATARQLLRRDEATGTSVPLLDGVAALTIELFADAAGSQAVTGLADADLRRVRRVRLTLRFVASNPLLHVPDLTLALDGVPRNLTGG